MDRGAWRATVPGVTKSQTRLCTLNHREETVTFTVDTCEKKMFILSHPNYFMVGRYFMLPLLIVCLNTSALCLLVSAVLLFVSSCSPSDDSSPFPPFSSLFKCELLSHVRLCDPTDCSPPGSSVQGILQARILEWVAISFSTESSQPRIQIHIMDSLPLSHQGSPVSNYLHTLPPPPRKKVNKKQAKNLRSSGF